MRYKQNLRKITMAAKVGRPPKYSPERVAQICELIARGETKETAAKAAGITPATFCEWQNTFPEFLEAVKRAEADFREWEQNGILKDAKASLRTLICGLEYEEIKTEYEQNPTEPNKPRIKKQYRTTKKVLPNVTAVIFALCNRDPENWKNRISQELSAKVETDGSSNVNLKSIPDNLLEQVMNALKSD